MQPMQLTFSEAIHKFVKGLTVYKYLESSKGIKIRQSQFDPLAYQRMNRVQRAEIKPEKCGYALRKMRFDSLRNKVEFYKANPGKR